MAARSLTDQSDRFEFLMGCLLEGAFSNPNIFNLEALKHGNGYLCKQVVDACAAAAEEALLVSDKRFLKPMKHRVMQKGVAV